MALANAKADALLVRPAITERAVAAAADNSRILLLTRFLPRAGRKR